MAPPSPPPSAPPSWVILYTLPRVALLGNNADIVLAPHDAPPRVTLLTLSPPVFPSTVDPCAKLRLPHIHAADPSGLLVAINPPGPVPPTPPPEPSESSDYDEDEDDGLLPVLLRINPRSPMPRSPSPEPSETYDYGKSDRVLPDEPLVEHLDYFVIDVPAATTTAVRGDYHRGIVYDWECPLGVIAAPGGAAGFMLAKFQTFLNTDMLICFSSETGEWFQKAVDNPPVPGRNWNFIEVISHDAKLWWVDPTAGLLACDPFADALKMIHVPLPEKEDDDEVTKTTTRRWSRASHRYSFERGPAPRRYVQVSNGKIRCVDMTRSRQGQGGAPIVTARTLADPETAAWTLEYEVSFDEIWAGDTYKASGLAEEEPELAFIHPENPDVVYLFIKECFFGVDLPARKVVECQARERAKGNASPSTILPFVLPPALRAALPKEVSDDGVKEDKSVAPPS